MHSLSWSCLDFSGGVLSVGHTYDTYLVHTLYTVQSIRTQFTLERICKLHTRTCYILYELSTLRFSNRTNLGALCYTIFLSLAVESRWGALAVLCGMCSAVVRVVSIPLSCSPSLCLPLRSIMCRPFRPSIYWSVCSCVARQRR